MVVQLTASFFGQAATTSALADLLNRYEKKATTAVGNTAEAISIEAKGSARYDSGALHDSIGWAWVRQRKDPLARVGTGIPYGRRIELDFVGPDSLGRSFNHTTLPAAWLGPQIPKVIPWLTAELQG